MIRKNNRLTEVVATLTSDNSGLSNIQFIPLETKEMLTENSNFDEICTPRNGFNDFPLQARASNPPTPKMENDMGRKIELKISLRETPWKRTNFYRIVHSKGSYAFGGQNMHSKWSFLAQKHEVLSTTFIFNHENIEMELTKYIPPIVVGCFYSQRKVEIYNLEDKRRTYPMGVFLRFDPVGLDKCSKRVKIVV